MFNYPTGSRNNGAKTETSVGVNFDIRLAYFKSSREPPIADPLDVVVWGEPEKNRHLPDYVHFIEASL